MWTSCATVLGIEAAGDTPPQPSPVTVVRSSTLAGRELTMWSLKENRSSYGSE
jgi:hypothetical protein